MIEVYNMIASNMISSNLRQWYGYPIDGTPTVVWRQEGLDPLPAPNLQIYQLHKTLPGLVPSLSFCHFPVRSNSEKDRAARKFLTINQPEPEQHLVFEFIWFPVR